MVCVLENSKRRELTRLDNQKQICIPMHYSNLDYESVTSYVVPVRA